MSIAVERPQPADELVTDEKQAGGIAGEELAELLHRGIVHDVADADRLFVVAVAQFGQSADDFLA